MEPTPVGAALFALAALAALAGPRWGAVVLGATIPMTAAAAAILSWGGGATLPCAAVAAAGLVAGAAPRLLAAPRPGGTLAPAGLLSAFVLFAVIGGYALPRIFDGATLVYALDRRISGVAAAGEVFPLTPLAPVAGGLTQGLYLVSSLCLFLVFAGVARRDPGAGPALLWAATASQLALAAADLAGAGWLSEFRTATYAIAPAQSLAGFTRLVGGATEPSVFGGLSAVLAIWHFWALRLRGGAGHLAAGGAMVALAVASLSSTALVVLAGGLALNGALSLGAARGPAARAGAAFLAAGAVAVAGWLALGPAAGVVAAGLDAVIFSKLDSASGVERAAWARQALVNFAETGGLGVGLGAARANGWAAAVLGQTGAPGLALALGFLVSALARRGDAAIRAAALAVLAGALLSASRVDLGYLFFALAGAHVGAAARLGAPAAAAAPPRPAGAPSPAPA